jgi:hypothetical protein
VENNNNMKNVGDLIKRFFSLLFGSGLNKKGAMHKDTALEKLNNMNDGLSRLRDRAIEDSDYYSALFYENQRSAVELMAEQASSNGNMADYKIVEEASRVAAKNLTDRLAFLNADPMVMKAITDYDNKNPEVVSKKIHDVAANMNALVDRAEWGQLTSPVRSILMRVNDNNAELLNQRPSTPAEDVNLTNKYKEQAEMEVSATRGGPRIDNATNYESEKNSERDFEELKA